MENNEMRVVSAPVQTVVRNPEPVPEAVDPMEELNHGIDELRGRLKLLLDETGVLTRKVKEAVLKQDVYKRQLRLRYLRKKSGRLFRMRMTGELFRITWGPHSFLPTGPENFSCFKAKAVAGKACWFFFCRDSSGRPESSI